MGDIRHHLTDDLLMGHSTGTLPEAFSVVVATHVSMCDECRARLDAMDALGGAVLDHCSEAAVSDESLGATMARIEASGIEFDAPRRTPPGAVLPEPLRSYVNGDVDAVKWSRVGGGVRQSVLETGESGSVRLLFIPGGTAVPDHSHHGQELTLVLQGAFSDKVSRFARGDVEIADEHLHHQPVAEEGEPCICLAATNAPLAFTGVLPRLVQRFVGI